MNSSINPKPIKKNKVFLNNVSALKLKLLSKEDILNESNGEVIKSETLNYKTHRPEKGSLFCEMIFGPVKDYVCSNCKKTHNKIEEGRVCKHCGKDIIRSSFSRRRTIGHINLEEPVAHIWYTKTDNSILASLLNIKKTELESIIYFRSHIITDAGSLKKTKIGTIIDSSNDAKFYYNILSKEIMTMEEVKSSPKKKKVVLEAIKDITQSINESLGRTYGISPYHYLSVIEDVAGAKIETGARAILNILKKINLEEEYKKELKIINAAKNLDVVKKNIKRVRIIKSFLDSGQDPQNMILETIAVTPPETRPLIFLDDKKQTTTDINDFYRRIIISNNRIKELKDNGFTSKIILNNEYRILQESVDALLDNAKKDNPIYSKNGKALLKSFTDILKGKKGRFRKNLVGKRVDYSGRSVIAVGPNLKINEVGIPIDIIVKIFEPMIINKLLFYGVAATVREAKRLLTNKDNIIWKYVRLAIKGKRVLLNRAPSLHRLSIQSFQPILTNSESILLHPFVTAAFNADFDGDQMAVHVPISKQSQIESIELMSPIKNILSLKDGSPIISPSQDVVLGLYWLTLVDKNFKSDIKIINSFTDFDILMENKVLDYHHPILLSADFLERHFQKIPKCKFLITTVGYLFFNRIAPKNSPYINYINGRYDLGVHKDHMIFDINEYKDKINNWKDIKPFNKKNIVDWIYDSYMRYKDQPEVIEKLLDDIKNLGFKLSTISSCSISYGDIQRVKAKPKIIAESEKQIIELDALFDQGFMSDDERYTKTVGVWSKAKDEIQLELSKQLLDDVFNPFNVMMKSGARGNISNFVQLSGMRGLMSRATTQYAAKKSMGVLHRSVEEIPVISSFKDGLNSFEFFLSSHGARKGLSDTATKTSQSGYLTRKLVDNCQDVFISEVDCGTREGIKVSDIIDTKTGQVIENLFDRIEGRVLAQNIEIKDKEIAKTNDYIDQKLASKIVKNLKSVKIRSPLTCGSLRGKCAKCFGKDLSTNNLVSVGVAIGIISAQSIGEPGTQLTMRTFHTGGVAGVSDITQGFDRLIEILDAVKLSNKNHAKIAQHEGEIIDITKDDLDSKGNKIMTISIKDEAKDIHRYEILPNSIFYVKKGDKVTLGDKLTIGSIDPYHLLEVAGQTKLQSYLIKELQKLYKLQGIDINDKYIEVILSKMLSKVKIIDPKDSNYYPGQIVSKDDILELKILSKTEKLKIPTFKNVLYGVKVIPTLSSSFLSAAAFQEVVKILSYGAISGTTDHLHGIKERSIIGRLIPCGTGLDKDKIKGTMFDIFSLEKYQNFMDLKHSNSIDRFDKNTFNSFIESDLKNQTGNEELIKTLNEL